MHCATSAWLHFYRHLTSTLGQARVAAAVLLLVLLASAATHAQAQVHYFYDELGRLIQVVAPNGSNAQYSYDAAGNITSIKKQDSSVISVSDFSPNAGPVGTTVTVVGSGFSTTLANNTVKFNGTTAVVSAATANSLTVKVPTGATTGAISVSTTAGSAASATSFVVGVAVPAPTITSFTPQMGAKDTVVTIAGTNFQLGAEDNKATIGAFNATVVQDASSPTSTQLKLIVPTDAASGKIAITTPFGKATSAADFFALPPGVNAADIEFKGRLTVNGTAVTATTTVAGKKAAILFDGSLGQALHLASGASSFATPPSVRVFAPDGRQIEQLSISPNSVADFTKRLAGAAATGTYLMLISPAATENGSVSLSLVSDVTGTLTVDGAGSAINLSAGRNAQYTFAAEAGKGYGLGITGLSFTPAGGSMSVQLHKPDGTYIAGCSFSANDSCNFAPGLFTAAGNYKLVFNPSGSNAASFTAMVSKDTTGSITVDAATPTTVTIAREGQNARYTFSGTAGQAISLVWSGNALSDGNAATNNYALISLAAPSNPDSAVTSVMVYENTATGSLDYTLTATGTYTVIVDPYGLLKGTVGMRVINK